jgi:hypothetical protein
VTFWQNVVLHCYHDTWHKDTHNINTLHNKLKNITPSIMSSRIMLSNIYAECHTFLNCYAECHYGKCRSVVTILAVRQCDSAGIDPLVVSSRLTSFTYYLFSLLDTCASRGVLVSISLKEQKFALKDIQSNLIMTGSRGATTLSITTFSLTTLSIKTFSMMTLSLTAKHCYAECRAC